jgi:hypothetical protein
MLSIPTLNAGSIFTNAISCTAVIGVARLRTLHLCSGEAWNSSSSFALPIIEATKRKPQMKTAYALTLAAALAGSAVLSMPAGADEVCDKNCVGPACSTTCTREPNATVGRDRRDRDEVIIEERNRRREPGVEIRERERRPGVDVDVERR